MARKEKKYHFIYKTTNLLSGRYYIGMHSTNDLNDGYLGSGRRLRYSINKYGKYNHKREIIEYCNSREELKSREEEIVNLNEIAKEDCMNLKVGGEGGFTSERHRLKCSVAGNIAYSNRLKTDSDFYDRVRIQLLIGNRKAHNEGKIPYDNFKGKKHTVNSKKKMSENRKGKGVGDNNSQYGSSWITNGKVNKKIKKESRIPNKWKLGRTL